MSPAVTCIWARLTLSRRPHLCEIGWAAPSPHLRFRRLTASCWNDGCDSRRVRTPSLRAGDRPAQCAGRVQHRHRQPSPDSARRPWARGGLGASPVGLVGLPDEPRPVPPARSAMKTSSGWWRWTLETTPDDGFCRGHVQGREERRSLVPSVIVSKGTSASLLPGVRTASD